MQELNFIPAFLYKRRKSVFLPPSSPLPCAPLHKLLQYVEYIGGEKNAGKRSLEQRALLAPLLAPRRGRTHKQRPPVRTVPARACVLPRVGPKGTMLQRSCSCESVERWPRRGRTTTAVHSRLHACRTVPAVSGYCTTYMKRQFPVFFY